MRVFYDHQIFCRQNFGGISRYFFELIKGFANNQQIQSSFSARFTNNFFANELINERNLLSTASFKGKKDIVRLLNDFITQKKLQKQEFDIYHPTYYNSHLLKYNIGKPLVVTVHDLVDEKFNNINPKFTGLIAQRKEMIQRADRVIAISESTRKDLLELFSIPADKICTIYHGNSLQADINPLGNRKKYILYVGSRSGIHKNFTAFLNAAILFLKKESDYQLICAGDNPFTAKELALINQYNLSNKIIHQAIVNDEQLARLYVDASLLIYLSLYEGFGFPIVEAFACGCPVLTNSASSMIEIAADEAFYFSSNYPEEMCTDILNALHNHEQREIKTKAGILKAKDFTWQNTLQKTTAVYQTLGS